MERKGSSSRWIARILAVIPGWGHVLLHRRGRGIVLFALFLFFLDVAALTWIRGDGVASPQFLMSTILCALLVVGSVASVARILSPRRRAAVDPLIRRHFREGVRHYLRAEYREAANEFRCTLALDPFHGEARMYLGMVLKNENRFAEARRALQDCLDGDREKWEWEIRRDSPEG